VLCFLYSFLHKCLIVSPSGECINLDTTVAGSFGSNRLEILMLSGSLALTIRFNLPTLNYIYRRTSLIGDHPF
jgi:hypothetical protein